MVAAVVKIVISCINFVIAIKQFISFYLWGTGSDYVNNEHYHQAFGVMFIDIGNVAFYCLLCLIHFRSTHHGNNSTNIRSITISGCKTTQ